MKTPVWLTPPVRTPDSYRVLPEGCTGCTWRWQTVTLPWSWVRVVPNLDCPAVHPDEATS